MMNLQHKIEVEVIRYGTVPGTLGINDTIESRLACISLLHRLGHIDDQTLLSMTVQCIQMYDALENQNC